LCSTENARAVSILKTGVVQRWHRAPSFLGCTNPADVAVVAGRFLETPADSLWKELEDSEGCLFWY
jgi:hypothetical protein